MEKGQMICPYGNGIFHARSSVEKYTRVEVIDVRRKNGVITLTLSLTA